MDELKQIITYKLKLIHNYRDKKPNSLEERQQMTELFVKQKRKQNSRDVIQSRLLQSLITKRIEAPYRIQQFYQQSIQLMQMYSPIFQYQYVQTKDPILNIVKLYGEFFTQQDCPRRAEELNHIFKKNLCEKGMLIPTVFHWFTEWLRKVFRDFIKSKLSQLSEKNSLGLEEENKNKRNKKFLQQINRQRASLSVIDSQIKLYKQNQNSLKLKSNKSKLLNFEFLLKPVGKCSKSSLLNYSQVNENSCVANLKDGNNKQLNHKFSPSNHTAPIVKFTKQSIEYQKQKNINLNKDIFFSAFFQQMSNYYKFYSCLPELDENFPRNFRKIDRREQINKNINILVKSMAKNQPNQIKNSLQQYSTMYSAKFGKILPSKQSNRLKNKIQRRRAESVNLRKQNISQNPLIQQKIVQKNNKEGSEIFFKRQLQTPGISIEKKKIQLELPDLKKFKSAEKVILVNSSNTQQLLTHRYKGGMNQKQRVSAQLYRELKQISSLFKSRKSVRLESLTINKQSLDQRISSIRYRRSKNQSCEILEPSGQSDGIFRLPKIHR